jgi:hypothetical protein
MQILVQLEPIATHIDPVSPLRIIQEIPRPLENFDILSHVSFLLVGYIFVG